MANYKVAEIFSSINGEGPRQGQLALFIRMQGCNLDCSYCDTRWANGGDTIFHWTSTEEILDLIRDMQIRNITLTGGEPLCQEDIMELLLALAAEPWIRVEIETNGSVDLKSFAEIPNAPSFNMDYKLPGSGMEDKMIPENFAVLSLKDTVKFVVKDHSDLLRSRDLIRTYDLTEKCMVFLSPVYGEIDPEDVVNFMKCNQMNDVTLQLQIHKVIWDSELRGV
ncbi:MAG: putative 7-carboxy-7-deazaguanine synthase QueE [Lachnospiraceae bacterium]|nr:putative 7-carboxy-7-deazaguanine synthase QueE [Lachnospiraceae bacterium]